MSNFQITAVAIVVVLIAVLVFLAFRGGWVDQFIFRHKDTEVKVQQSGDSQVQPDTRVKKSKLTGRSKIRNKKGKVDVSKTKLSGGSSIKNG